jgi:putative transposase
MKRKRHRPEQIIAKLREADVALTAGGSVEQICKQLEIGQATYHKWRKQYGGMKADEMKRLKELERENARLKKIVADQAVDISILKEVAKGNF